MTACSPHYPCVYRAAILLALLALLGSPTLLRAAVLPAPPQVLIDTTPPPSPGALIVVGAGGSFQAALNAAQPGDEIRLQAGAVYTGNFTLPAKSGTGWITITSSAADSLPPYGRRVTPAYAPAMPKLVTVNTSPVIATAPGAHHYRFVGIEMMTNVQNHYVLVAVGDAGAAQDTIAKVPYAITFDRVYVHGTPSVNLQRGISLNGASIAVVNSYLSELHYAGLDSQAVAGWNGPGPFKIVNNYLEAAGENIMFGGADPSIVNLVPSDIEIRGNHLFKPVSWRGSSWTVKNLFELKNARRVLVDGNIFENNWAQAQTGLAILFTVRNQDGTAPWSIVSDVTFTHNVVRHVAGGVNILGLDDIRSSQRTQRILIQHNLFEDVNGGNWGGQGRLFQLLNGAESVTIDHNTAFQSGDFIVASQLPQLAFTFTNNLLPNNQYGLVGDGCLGIGCFSTFLQGAVMARNGIIGGNAGSYPANNLFPVNMAAVGFSDLSGGIYQLSSASPYRASGTDGRDLGVDWPALTTAVAGVISGVAPGVAAPPSDSSAPIVAITAPAAGSTVSGSATVSASASDANGIARVVFQLNGSSVQTLTTGPFQMAWDTRQSANGAHTLTAVATDTAGNVTASTPVTVTVSNAGTALLMSTPSISSVTSTGAVVGWTTNAQADSQVQYGVTTGYGSVTPLSTTLTTSHSRTLTGLAPSTLYHVRALSRGESGSQAASADLTFTTAASTGGGSAGGAPEGAVTWTSTVNVTAVGGALQKTAGCNGCPDAGAVSSQSLSSGDGYVEFTLKEITTQRAIGLSRGNAGTTMQEILFALVPQPSGYVEVRESGVYRAEAAGSVNDRFRVAVAGGRVTYMKNGTVFHTSAAAPVYPLLVDTAFLTSGSTLNDVVFAAGGAAPASSTSVAAAPAGTVTWTSLVNVAASGGTLQKTAGCNGCQDAGAASSQSLASGDGYVEFTLAEVTSQRAIGLSRGNAGTTMQEILFALVPQPSGYVEVRESGSYRAEVRGAANDRFRVTVTGGRVTYSKNGTVFYTSTAAPVYPLLVDTAFLTSGSTLSDVVFSAGSVVASTGTTGAVTWTSLVNVTASGGSLQKTSGCNGCPDAGAVSSQTLTSGNGYVEFTVGPMNAQRALGLSRGNAGTSAGEILFGLTMQPSGLVEVREMGGYRAETAGSATDRFRIAVVNGKVTYAKNGTVFYTSASAPVYPLLVDTTFLTTGGSVTNVVMATGQ